MLLLRRGQRLVGRRYLRQRSGKLLHGHAGLDPCRDQQIHHTGREPIQLRVRIRGLGTSLDGGLLCFIQLVQLLCNILIILLCALVQLIQLLQCGFLCRRQQVVRAHARQHLFIGGGHFLSGLGSTDGLRRLGQQLFDLLTLGRGGDRLDLSLVAVVQVADHLLAALLLQKLPVKQRIAAVDAADAVHQSLKERIRRQDCAFLHAVALAALPAHHEPASVLAHRQARIILAVYGIACQRAYQRSGCTHLQVTCVIAVLQRQAFIAIQRAGRVFALLATQDTADDGAARHGAGIIAAAHRDAARRRKADDAACAALSQQYSAGIIGHRALIGALVQRNALLTAAISITHDAAHTGCTACIDRAGIDAALQLCAGTDKTHDTTLAATTAGAAQIVGARREGGVDPALIPAIRDLMAAAAGETAYQTAHRGILGFLIVDEGDGDIYLRHAVANGHAAALAAAQQAADDITCCRIVRFYTGQLDAASYRQVLNDRILRHAEQAQLLAAAQRRDIQTGHRVALSVEGTGIGTLAITAEDADNRPLTIAEVDIRRQHRAVACALHLVIHRVGQPCQLLRRSDLVRIVLRALAMGLAGGDAVPAVLGAGGIQQFLQLAAGRGIGLLNGSQALLPRLLNGCVVGQLVQLHRCRRLNSGFAALQCIVQQLLTLLVEAADIAQLGRQLRDTLLCQRIQLLPRRIAGLLQRCRCRRVHVRRRIALREGGCQVGQRLSGVGLDDLDFLCGGCLIQL